MLTAYTWPQKLRHIVIMERDWENYQNKFSEDLRLGVGRGREREAKRMGGNRQHNALKETALTPP